MLEYLSLSCVYHKNNEILIYLYDTTALNEDGKIAGENDKIHDDEY